MDPAGWFEVTPESVARHIADRMQYGLVVDGTCGVGGNAIQFALTSRRVIAVDTDANRLEDAAHNASIYGVKDRIEFVCDDFANFASMYRGPQIDAVFLSPPWGGPAHLDAGHFSLKDVTCPDIVKLFAAGAAISQRVVLYLPRHADLNEMVLLASASGFGCCEVEKVFFEYPTRHLKLVVVYFSPEAISSPTPSVSKKKIGATGDRNRSHQKAKTSSALATISGGTCQLWGLPPIVGPIVRALHCRFHYVGRFAVAAALAVEKHQQKQRLAQAQLQNSCCHSSLRKQAALAIAKVACNCASDEQDISTDSKELVACLQWLLGEVSVASLVKLCQEVVSGLSTSDIDGAGSEHIGLHLGQALKRQMPEVHERLLAWRKAAALRATTLGALTK
jgi:predicted RNA methylase